MFKIRNIEKVYTEKSCVSVWVLFYAHINLTTVCALYTHLQALTGKHTPCLKKIKRHSVLLTYRNPSSDTQVSDALPTAIQQQHQKALHQPPKGGHLGCFYSWWCSIQLLLNERKQERGTAEPPRERVSWRCAPPPWPWSVPLFHGECGLALLMANG